ncbi:MAG: glycerol-3-phosphate dehydrogenase [Chloroflexota bacterium]|nr:glycerol-3-phosphate dehydrogenase [Chloroflexota bacterium]
MGGGIIGAGITRDAALRGLSVALVEARDLASGTSSRPTRLIHGGLRYLENLDLGLVREDMREREVLLRVAPHLVFPLPFHLPMYRPSLFERAKLRAGMLLYDALSFDKSLPRRTWLEAADVRQLEPGIEPDGLRGAWRFYDAQVPYVERLVVENTLDAAAHGAAVLNHARASRFVRDASGRVTGATVMDAIGGREVKVAARLTVNATGPWLDATTRDLRPAEHPLLRLTKGVHLVTERGTSTAQALFAKSDGRLFFIVPWNGFSLIGTTDTDYHGDPADVAADEEDVRYLLGEARRAFPSAPFDQVHYTWAGVRALVRTEGVKEGEVSRKHEIHDHERRDGIPGLLSVVGGKITGYRAIAEEVVDAAGRMLGHRVACGTARTALPGGELDDVARFGREEVRPRARELGVDARASDHLVRTYGALALAVLDLVRRDASLTSRLCPHEPVIAAELVRAVETEWAATVGDALLRRTGLGLAACQGAECVTNVAARVAELLGWDATECEAQVAAYRAEIEPMRRFRTARA